MAILCFLAPCNPFEPPTFTIQLANAQYLHWRRLLKSAKFVSAYKLLKLFDFIYFLNIRSIYFIYKKKQLVGFSAYLTKIYGFETIIVLVKYVLTIVKCVSVIRRNLRARMRLLFDHIYRQWLRCGL